MSAQAAAAPSSALPRRRRRKAFDVEGGVIQVAARTSGIVSTVYAQAGDSVTKGEASWRARKTAAPSGSGPCRPPRRPWLSRRRRADRLQTDVQIKTAAREYARAQPLAASSIVSGQQVDQDHDAIAAAQATLGVQRAAVVAARAKLAEAQYALEQTVIRAPVDGRIVRRYANPGYGASTLNVTPMFDLEPAGQRIVRAEVTEDAIASVKVGQSVRLTARGRPVEPYVGAVLRRAGVFGARKLQSDDPSERADEGAWSKSWSAPTPPPS